MDHTDEPALGAPKTYIEMAGIFVIVVLGTLGYWASGQWAPFVLVGLMLTLLVTTRLVGLIKGLRTLDSAWAWLAWLAYGLLFEPFRAMDNWIVVVVQSIAFIAVVGLSYLTAVRRLNTILIIFLIVFALIGLFVPHRDSVPTPRLMHLGLLGGKVLGFYLIYAWSALTAAASRRSESWPLRLARLMQAGWILLASRWILALVLLQIGLILFETFTKPRKDTDSISSSSSAAAIEEGRAPPLPTPPPPPQKSRHHQPESVAVAVVVTKQPTPRKTRPASPPRPTPQHDPIDVTPDNFKRALNALNKKQRRPQSSTAAKGTKSQ